MQVIWEEFEKATREIDTLRVDWNYLDRFGVPSFNGKDNWVISEEEFCTKL